MHSKRTQMLLKSDWIKYFRAALTMVPSVENNERKSTLGNNKDSVTRRRVKEG